MPVLLGSPSFVSQAVLVPTAAISGLQAWSSSSMTRRAPHGVGGGSCRSGPRTRRWSSERSSAADDDASWQRRSLCGASACAAVVAGATARPRKARAQTSSSPEGGQQQRLLLGDPEVEEIRKLQRSFRLYDVKQQRWLTLPELLRKGELLHEADAVCIGEIHTSDADHTVQRLLLDALTYQLFLELRSQEGVDPSQMRGVTPQNRSPKRLAIGVEYFRRQQQATLDEFIFAGKMKGDEFRKAIDWENVWNYDWALFAPLMRFCQLNVTRVVGLNLPFEATLQVSRQGMGSLPQELRELLPDLDLSKRRHRRRFEDLIAGASIEESVARMRLPESEFTPRPQLDSMYESQTLWDEYMAETAQNYLAASGGRLVILAGVNHIWRDAIPDRLEARSRRAGGKLRCASIAPWRGSTDPADLPTCADYLWCGSGPGGGEEVAAAMQAQRMRLKGKPRVFPAGYI